MSRYGNFGLSLELIVYKETNEKQLWEYCDNVRQEGEERRRKLTRNAHCVPRTIILLPRRPLLAIVRTLLYIHRIHTLLRRGILLHRYGRAHPGECVLNVSILCLILARG